MNQDTKVTLAVPADPQFARCVRVLVADVATIAGASIDEVEDLRMAAEEGFVYAQAVSGTPITLTLSVFQNTCELAFSFSGAKADASEIAAEQLTYMRLILDAVATSYELDEAAGTLAIQKELSREQ